MSNNVQVIAIAFCAVAIGLSLYLLQVTNTFTATGPAAAIVAADPDAIVVSDELAADLTQTNNPIMASELSIEDITIGTGQEAATGDMVAVHYVGKLQNGTEFDNSVKRGAPIEFTLGSGQVIAGWEEGIAGMKVGGERTLVIPPEKAYGEQGIGPIPPNATLVFQVELVAIK
jgi:FKBP-type peptidyl-prolyl cis-trans isomerase